MRRFRRDWSHGGDSGRYQRRREYFDEEPETSYSCSRERRTREEVVTPPLPEQAASGSLMATSVDFKTHVDQACRAAEEFVNIYYETMDKRRRALTRLYLDKATLIWNGNVVTGLEALTNFFEMLPSSEFQVNMLDCQPVHEQATQAQTTVLVVTSGTVKFDGNKQHYFNQNFLLTAQSTPTNTVWKIASDCFRFQDWASS
ncbi:NTF2-related export protein 2 isoform X1 [Mustela lutreola]|uniref:NTF2-related export protein 2 isoform X1 n=5 Tax=Mustelinae TaxID=169418 RepID=M3XXZ0_MUSPF|nr:NTF2-related export protein 2 isoform X1 [Mustela putorius furo]XP_059013930.1 NTF2-related export protein 2 isoform X1 [Mustela lutreola]